MQTYFKTNDLSVGYHGKVLIHGIDLEVEKGSILTLIGPNGAGKSTILKTIVRQLDALCGTVYLEQQDVLHCPPKELAKKMAVVLTDRSRPELMTCAEVVAMGRYPHTGLFGVLTAEDRAAVREALERVRALELAQQEFSTLSDGQRQRILLARALCQEPEVLVLDEPTAYLDIRYKLELLDILRDMARRKRITVILSLHEIDLAVKISDRLLCVKGETIAAFGPPEQILAEHTVERLYGMERGAYNRLFGSVELSKPTGAPQIFVVGGGGYGIACYRALQKRQIPFAGGILFENDVDYQVAAALSDHLVVCPAFSGMTQAQYDDAVQLMRRCGAVLDAGAPVGALNRLNGALLEQARAEQIPIYTREQWDREERT